MTNSVSVDVAQVLADALADIAITDLAEVIAAAGITAVYADLQTTRIAVTDGEDPIRVLAVQIALLADERRRWARRCGGAVAQARHEHHRAEQLAAELQTLRAVGAAA